MKAAGLTCGLSLSLLGLSAAQQNGQAMPVANSQPANDGNNSESPIIWVDNLNNVDKVSNDLLNVPVGVVDFPDDPVAPAAPTAPVQPGTVAPAAQPAESSEQLVDQPEKIFRKVLKDVASLTNQLENFLSLELFYSDLQAVDAMKFRVQMLKQTALKLRDGRTKEQEMDFLCEMMGIVNTVQEYYYRHDHEALSGPNIPQWTPPEIPKDFDVKYYSGDWYKVASSYVSWRMHASDERCTIDTYAQLLNGTIEYISASAFPVAPVVGSIGMYKPGKFQINYSPYPSARMCLPTSRWVLATGPVTNNQYEWALLSDPFKLTPSVLVRNPDKFFQSQFQVVADLLEKQGFTHPLNMPINVDQEDMCTKVLNDNEEIVGKQLQQQQQQGQQQPTAQAAPATPPPQQPQPAPAVNPFPNLAATPSASAAPPANDAVNLFPNLAAAAPSQAQPPASPSPSASGDDIPVGVAVLNNAAPAPAPMSNDIPVGVTIVNPDIAAQGSEAAQANAADSTDDEDDKKKKIVIIATSVAGGIALLVALVAALLVMRRRRRVARANEKHGMNNPQIPLINRNNNLPNGCGYCLEPNCRKREEDHATPMESNMNLPAELKPVYRRAPGSMP